ARARYRLDDGRLVQPGLGRRDDHLAIEYVEGEPVLAADERADLAPEDRHLLGAVQAAHPEGQRLLLFRQLCPSPLKQPAPRPPPPAPGAPRRAGAPPARTPTAGATAAPGASSQGDGDSATVTPSVPTAIPAHHSTASAAPTPSRPPASVTTTVSLSTR